MVSERWSESHFPLPALFSSVTNRPAEPQGGAPLAAIVTITEQIAAFYSALTTRQTHLGCLVNPQVNTKVGNIPNCIDSDTEGPRAGSLVQSDCDLEFQVSSSVTACLTFVDSDLIHVSSCVIMCVVLAL